jgi:glycosyltransferase involved in cell wall biosynthesis
MNALQIGKASLESRGGADRYYFELMDALQSFGISGSGLVLGEPGDTAERDSVATFAQEGASIFARWQALRSRVRERLPDCDIVASHFAAYAFPVLDIIRKRPMVVHFHGSWSLESAFEGKDALSIAAKHAIEQAVYSRAARYVVLSHAAGTMLEREFHIPRPRIHVIPGGVNMKRFRDPRSRAAAREGLGWPVDRPIVLTVSRLVQLKGVANMIWAIEQVRQRVPDVLLVVAGTGPHRASLARQVRARGLSDCVKLIGHVGSDLPAVYRAADVSVVPSLALETFGLVVIESLACGTPALVTPVAGLPEVVQDLDPRLICAGTAPAELAQRLIDVLSGGLTLPTSEQCRSYAARFDWSIIAGRIASVYREVA